MSLALAILFVGAMQGCSDSEASPEADASRDEQSGDIIDAAVVDSGADGMPGNSDAMRPAEDASDAASQPLDAASPPPPTFNAVHAIFANKCGPCHTSGGDGGHNMGAPNINAAYADSQLAATTTGGTKGFAALIRIQNGSMPAQAGCSGNPATDINNASCLTQAELNTLQAWINGGQQAPQ